MSSILPYITEQLLIAYRQHECDRIVCLVKKIGDGMKETSLYTYEAL